MSGKMDKSAVNAMLFPVASPIKVKSLVEWCDAHNDPSTFREGLVIKEGNRIGATLVCAGDGPDMVAYGKDKFWNWALSIISAAEGRNIYMVDSNHAPEKWLKEMFAPWPNIKIAQFWEFELPNGLVVHVRHGHEFFVDWYFLRWIAPPVTNFLCHRFPGQWYWIANKMGWQPGMGPMTEERYHIVVDRIWSNMTKLALERSKELSKTVVVLSAHTHAIGILRGAFHGVLRVLHADSGTVAIGSYIEVTDEVRLKRLDPDVIAGGDSEDLIKPNIFGGRAYESGITL